MLHDLVLRNRSYRRFNQAKQLNGGTLRELVDLARLSASGKNAQPLKYILIHSEEACAQLYPQLAWAGYLKDWDGPIEGERPAAYLIMLGDKTIAESFGIDPGIASQSILLGAVEKGLGGCILGSIKREEIRGLFNIDERFDILYVIALGEPVEKVVVEALPENGEIKYWRNELQEHHVPKRSLNDVILSER